MSSPSRFKKFARAFRYFLILVVVGFIALVVLGSWQRKKWLAEQNEKVTLLQQKMKLAEDQAYLEGMAAMNGAPPPPALKAHPQDPNAPAWQNSSFYQLAKDLPLPQALTYVSNDEITRRVTRLCKVEKVTDAHCICFLAITEEARNIKFDDSGKRLPSVILDTLVKGDVPEAFQECQKD